MHYLHENLMLRAVITFVVTLILSIRDTGKGIKNPKKVFERFYKEHERGVGIGLHIVEKLSKVLGVEVKLETVLGEGTTVFLRLSKEMLMR